MATMNLKLILCILPGLIAVSSAARQYQASFQAMSSGYPHAGLVKVYIDGAWGTICASDWDMNDAEVVCRELGKGYPNTITVSGTLPSFSASKCLSSVKCYGHEQRLSDCPTPVKRTRANGNNDKGIVCFPPPSDAGLRLVRGPDQYSGFVEVKLSSGSWDELYGYYRYGYLPRQQYIPNICRQLGLGELNWWDVIEWSSSISMTKVYDCAYGVADHRSCSFDSHSVQYQAFVACHKPGAINCSAPYIPANAHLPDRRLNYNFGDRITVTCNTSLDTFTLQCHNKGLWSGPVVSCPAPLYPVGLPAKCSAPIIPRYSAIRSLQLSYNHGESVTVQCDNSSVQPFTLRCNTTGLWIGQMQQCPPPIAEPVRCNSPYIPRYGSIDNLRLDYSVGASVRITCDNSTDSYDLRCNFDGFWTGSVLSCPAPVEAPEKCSAPYVPRYATIQDLRMSYDFSERITVTCDNSTTQFILRCHTHGLWSGPVVSCPEPYRPPEQCSAPYVPMYATIQDLRMSYDFNERITVTCDNSTTQFILRCHTQGLWSGPVVSCPEPYRPPTRCNAPSIPRYSSVRNVQASYDLGARVNVRCDNNSVRFALRCRTGGLWEGQVQACPTPVEIPEQCSAPYVPRYATIQGLKMSYDFNERITVTCDNSTTQFILICHTHGLWSGPVVTCPEPYRRPIRCNSPYIPRHGSIDNLHLDYSVGTSVRITCDNSTDSYSLRCNSDGFWTGSVLSCPAPIEAPTRCNAPSIPRYSSVRNLQASYDLGARVIVRCDNSSVRFGLRCRTGGLWEGQVAVCPPPTQKPIRCNSPYIPRYGSIDNLRLDYSVGASVRITCDTSPGSYNLQCNSDGFWTGSVLSCPAPIEVPEKCSAPYVPRYATIQGLKISYDFNERITVTCDNSSTEFTLQCHMHGIWSGPVVSCPEPDRQPVRCNSPYIPRYGSIDNLRLDYSVGAIVRITCDNSTDNYSLRCNSDGFWTGSILSCPAPIEAPVQCSAPYVPRYATIQDLRMSYDFNERITVTCDNSSTQFVLHCHMHGLWSGPVVSCPEPYRPPVKCSAPYVPRYATIQSFQLSYDYNDRITVTCDGSSTQFILQCDTNGLWKGQAVSCPEPPQVPRQCNAPAIPRYSSIEGQQLAYSANDEVDVTCDGSSSQFTLRCNNAGIWTGPDIDCPAPDPGATHQTFCSAPVVPRHSTNQNLRLSYKPGDRVNVTCNEDPSSFLLVCREGIWIGQNIVCEEPAIECDPPIIPAVSSVPNLKPRYKVGDEVNVTCNGDSDWFIWECHRDGKWRGRAIDCPIPRPSLGHVSAVPGNTADRKAENESTGFLTTVLLVTALIVFVLVLMSMAGFSIFVKRRVRSSSNEYLHDKSTDRGPLPDVPSGYAGYIAGDKPLYTEPYLQPDRNTQNYEDYDTPR